MNDSSLRQSRSIIGIVILWQLFHESVLDKDMEFLLLKGRWIFRSGSIAPLLPAGAARVDDLSMTALIKTTSTIKTVTTIVKTIG